MNNLNHLNLQSAIVPLFDFTLNDFTKASLDKLFQEPLPSIPDIENRQQIIKGFLSNAQVIQTYSYSRLDFHEVHAFLHDPFFQQYKRGAKLQWIFASKEWHYKRAKFIQVIMLLHKLQVYYIQRINTSFFPEAYKTELVLLNDLLSAFNLSHYDKLIRENKFRTGEIIALTRLISGKQINGEIDLFYKRLFLFETYLTVSKGISKYQFCFPSFGGNRLLFEDVFHPLINNSVKNTFATNKSVVLLTGPNMSGKSTFLKAIGLCVYLAHLGLAVPATKVEIPFFEHIAVSMTHADDISKGYSHFMNEIMGLKQVLLEANANKKCFAVFDELFKGTNIDDSVQISATTICGLAQYDNSFFFISTHLHHLNEMDEVKSERVATYHFDCRIQDHSPVFDYKIKEGWSHQKIGQLLFEKAGINDLLRVIRTIQPDRPISIPTDSMDVSSLNKLS